jgi:hypothetical protein
MLGLGAEGAAGRAAHRADHLEEGGHPLSCSFVKTETLPSSSYPPT